MTTSVHVVKKAILFTKKKDLTEFSNYPHIVVPKKGFEKTKPSFSSKYDIWGIPYNNTWFGLSRDPYFLYIGTTNCS